VAATLVRGCSTFLLVSLGLCDQLRALLVLLTSAILEALFGRSKNSLASGSMGTLL